MNQIKKCIALFLAISLTTLTACDKSVPTPDNEVPMGRYVEERWELPVDAANISILTRMPDGRVLAIMKNNGPAGNGESAKNQAFTTVDGQDWKEETLQWLQILVEQGGIALDIAYGKNEECYLLYADADYSYHIGHIAPDGSIQKMPMEWENANLDSVATQETSSDTSGTGDGSTVETAETEPEASESEATDSDATFFPSAIHVGEDGDLYIAQMFSNTMRVGADGKLKQEFEGESEPIITSYDSQLAIINYDGNHNFNIHDVDTGEITLELDSQMLLGAGSDFITTGEDGALYVANANGIYRLIVSGTTWERILDGNLCSLSIPSMGMYDFVAHHDNEFLTLVYEQSKPVLINYAYSDDTPTRPTIELMVTTLKKNDTLHETAGKIRRAHPEILVNVQTLLEEDSAATTADAIRTLNTQLLAGNGPDLLLLDGLPMDSYIEKGVLSDMGDWANPLIEQQLLPNVAGVFNKEGAIYAIPTRFSIPTLWGKPDAIQASASMEKMVDYAGANPDKKLMRYMQPEELFHQFYRASVGAWLDESGKLDQARFAQYLELIGQIAATSNELPKEETSPSEEWLSEAEWNSALELGYGIVEVACFHLNGFRSIIVPNGAISALNGNSDGTSIEDSLIPAHLALLPGQMEGTFTPGSIIGINAASTQQELAREFVETMLGEAVQYSDYGFPVNKAAIEANIVRMDDVWMGTSEDMEDGTTRYLDAIWPSDGVRRAIVQLFEQLKTPYLHDDTLMEMILSETKGYFEGTMSAEQTAAAVASRMEIYLAEQGRSA